MVEHALGGEDENKVDFGELVACIDTTVLETG